MGKEMGKKEGGKLYKSLRKGGREEGGDSMG